MQLSGVRPSVCLSVPPGRRTSLLRVCCCGPGDQQTSYRLLHGRRSAATAPQRRAAAECGQCHVVSSRRKLNIGLSDTAGISRRRFLASTACATIRTRCRSRFSTTPTRWRSTPRTSKVRISWYIPCSKQNRDTKLVALTLLILNRFSIFLALLHSPVNLQQSRLFIKDPTASHTRRYTTLWNLAVRKWATIAN